MAYDKDSFLAGLSAGRTLRGASAGAGGGGEGGGSSSLYIEDVGDDPAPENVDFSKYKANDVILVVRNMEVSS